MGTKNQPGEFDCYANAEPDEPMFILLGRDALAGPLVLLWAAAREALHMNTEEKIVEARRCATAMMEWAVSQSKSITIAKEGLHAAMLQQLHLDGVRPPPEVIEPVPRARTRSVPPIGQLPTDLELRQTVVDVLPASVLLDTRGPWAAAFNEWMRQTIEETDKFMREWESVLQFERERLDSKVPDYGNACAAFFEGLLRAAEAA
jgi:hypothetical protein